MKAEALKKVVENTLKEMTADRIEDMKRETRGRKPPDLVSTERIQLREARLAEAEIRPSPTARERILGINDLVDVNYLVRASRAARSVCRIVLRDRAGREIGYGTGFKVTPRLLMTNHHVLETTAAAETAHAEFDYELDATGFPKATTRFALDPRAFYLSDPGLDFTLVAVAAAPVHGPGRLDDFAYLPMLRAEGKINQGEFMSVIQHPSGQPKQIALRENELLKIEERVLWYQSDTAQGSSGSPVFNDSWQIVALHHSGVPRTDAGGHWLLKNGQPAGADAEDSEIDWIANEGIRASRIVGFVESNGERGPLLDDYLRAAAGQLPPGPAPADGESAPAPGRAAGLQQPAAPPVPSASITVPVTFTISVAGVVPPSAEAPASAGGAAEKMKVPLVDADYGNRPGYDPDFLGIAASLPEVLDPDQVARLEDGGHVLPYEHFSIVMDKSRRLAMLTASNVDARPEKKEPEEGRDYSRKGLAGLGPKDTEMWLMDPRIPESHQLPDRFYTRDGGAFDKGHLVRREDVCWGDTYLQVQRANGDTYHTTNCSPQVADFNRSGQGGLWGRLENEILRQARSERYCLFAGPWLQDGDRIFVGRDHRGEVRIRIPSAYWKIVVARKGNALQAFAFLLRQDLRGVPLEFAATAEWAGFMVSIRELEAGLGCLRFDPAIVQADQFQTVGGDELLRSEALAGLTRSAGLRRG